MRYMFLMYSQETDDGPPPEEIERLIRDHSAVVKEATEKGILLAVEGLKPTVTATSVRMKEGNAITLEAIEWAKRMPTSCKGEEGGIEIRPVADLPRAV